MFIMTRIEANNMYRQCVCVCVCEVNTGYLFILVSSWLTEVLQ